MKRISKTKRLLFLLRIKNMLVFLIVSLCLLWAIKLAYGRFGDPQKFWSFLDRLTH